MQTFHLTTELQAANAENHSSAADVTTFFTLTPTAAKGTTADLQLSQTRCSTALDFAMALENPLY